MSPAPAIRTALAALFVLIAAPVLAADWTFEDGAVPIAYADNGVAQFQFACRGGDLAMGYWVRTPHRQVAGATSMTLALTPDPAAGADPASTRGAVFAEQIPLIHSDGASMIIRGPVARNWARLAQRAATGLRLAYVRDGAREVFDSNDFGASGSAAAIKRVLDRCG